MRLVFSDLYPIERLSQLQVSGSFFLDWDGSYGRYTSGRTAYRQPDPGSGLAVRGLTLLSQEALPPDIAPMAEATGAIYVLVSVGYPILYVGISDGSLRAGVFGSTGRLTHHARKLLAARGALTNHTGGWIAHARCRYADVMRRAREMPSVDHLQALAPSLWGDWRMACVSVASPRLYEGSVLDALRPHVESVHGACEVLNTGAVKRTDVEVVLPGNWQTQLFRAPGSPRCV